MEVFSTVTLMVYVEKKPVCIIFNLNKAVTIHPSIYLSIYLYIYHLSRYQKGCHKHETDSYGIFPGP